MKKAHTHTIINHVYYPLITLPTRFTRTNGTLTDNFFVNFVNLFWKVQQGF